MRSDLGYDLLIETSTCIHDQKIIIIDDYQITILAILIEEYFYHILHRNFFNFNISKIDSFMILFAIISADTPYYLRVRYLPGIVIKVFKE